MNEDLLDSPGYYQQPACMSTYVHSFKTFGVYYRFIKNGTIRYLLFKPDNEVIWKDGVYVQKLWWGGYRLVRDRDKATLWEDADEAIKWAQKRHLIKQPA